MGHLGTILGDLGATLAELGGRDSPNMTPICPKMARDITKMNIRHGPPQLPPDQAQKRPPEVQKMLQKCTPKRPYLTRSSIAKGASPVLHWLVFRKTMYAFFVFLNTNFWLPFSELQIAIRWVKKTLPGRHDVPPGGSQKTTEPEGNCMSEQVHPYAGAYAPKSYACAGHLQPSWGDPWPSWGDLGRPSAVLERS